MTPEKLKSVFAKYRAELEEDYAGIDPVQLAGVDLEAPSDTIGHRRRIAHLKFMCDEAQRFVDAGRIEKAMRWLGFLQGVFWATGRFALEHLKNHSRPDSPEG